MKKTKTAFDHKSFSQRLNSMLRVDFRRMFTSSMLWIMLGCALVMPILVLVMTTGFAGTTIADPNTGDFPFMFWSGLTKPLMVYRLIYSRQKLMC